MPPSALALTLLLGLGLSIHHVQARELLHKAPEPMCASMGVTTAVSKAPLPACLTLYPSGTAIRVPKDCAVVKYGTVWVSQGYQQPLPSTFIDRTGRQFSFSTSLLPKSIVISPSSSFFWSQLIFAATFNAAGNITALKPVLFIDETAYIKPFMKTKFVGVVKNLDPASGVPASQYIRWDFGATFSNYTLGQNTIQALSGTFSNYFQGTRNGSVCEPALCATAAQKTWYTEFFGNGTAMQLYWNPAMHFAGDSEFVPSFSSAITYMAGAPRPNELLVANINLARTYTFIIHGTPVGTPQSFVGKFSKQLTAPVLC